MARPYTTVSGGKYEVRLTVTGARRIVPNRNAAGMSATEERRKKFQPRRSQYVTKRGEAHERDVLMLMFHGSNDALRSGFAYVREAIKCPSCNGSGTTGRWKLAARALWRLQAARRRRAVRESWDK